MRKAPLEISRSPNLQREHFSFVTPRIMDFLLTVWADPRCAVLLDETVAASQSQFVRLMASCLDAQLVTHRSRLPFH